MATAGSTWRGARSGGGRASQIVLLLLLPMDSMRSSSGGVHSRRSSSSERTLVMCVPRLRCTPAQSMHRSTPRLIEAHVSCGALALQSAQLRGEQASEQRRERGREDRCDTLPQGCGSADLRALAPYAHADVAGWLACLVWLTLRYDRRCGKPRCAPALHPCWRLRPHVRRCGQTCCEARSQCWAARSGHPQWHSG